MGDDSRKFEGMVAQLFLYIPRRAPAFLNLHNLLRRRGSAWKVISGEYWAGPLPDPTRSTPPPPRGDWPAPERETLLRIFLELVSRARSGVLRGTRKARMVKRQLQRLTQLIFACEAVPAEEGEECVPASKASVYPNRARSCVPVLDVEGAAPSGLRCLPSSRRRAL